MWIICSYNISISGMCKLLVYIRIVHSLLQSSDFGWVECVFFFFISQSSMHLLSFFEKFYLFCLLFMCVCVCACDWEYYLSTDCNRHSVFQPYWLLSLLSHLENFAHATFHPFCIHLQSLTGIAVREKWWGREKMKKKPHNRIPRGTNAVNNTVNRLGAHCVCV